jgi:hypothetical protein
VIAAISVIAVSIYPLFYGAAPGAVEKAKAERRATFKVLTYVLTWAYVKGGERRGEERGLGVGGRETGRVWEEGRRMGARACLSLGTAATRLSGLSPCVSTWLTGQFPPFSLINEDQSSELEKQHLNEQEEKILCDDSPSQSSIREEPSVLSAISTPSTTERSGASPWIDQSVKTSRATIDAIYLGSDDEEREGGAACASASR